MKHLRKISNTELRSWAIGHVKAKQGGVCPLCNKPIDFTTRGGKQNYAVDHNHETGEIRGVLHASCNGAEGKIVNAAGRWGSKDTSYEAVVPFLKRLIAYWETEGTGIMYPRHKTPEERKEAANLKRRKQAAARRAAERVKELNGESK